MSINISNSDSEGSDNVVENTHSDMHLTRRGFLRTSFAAALLTAAGCGKDEPQKVSSSRVEVQFSPSSVPEIEVDSSIIIPKFDFSSKPVVFEKPSHLPVDQEAFLEISYKFSQIVLQGIKTYLIPTLDQNPHSASQIVGDFVSRITGIIEEFNPHAAQEMAHFQKVWNRMPETLVAHINEYLNPSGWNLVFHRDPNSKFQLNCHPITKTETMNVDDGTLTYVIPILHLGSPLIQHPTQLVDNGTSATMDSAFHYALVFDDRLDAGVQRTLSARPKYPNFQRGGGTEDLKKTLLRDFLQHETTHGYLARRFPTTGTITEMTEAFEIPLNVSREGRPFVSLSGVYPPASFHELCGVGIQIARTVGSVPDFNVMYLTHDLPDTYRFMSKIFPLATLQVAPQTALRDELVRDLGKGAMDFNGLKELIGTPPFTMDHARRVGEIMYRLGFKLFDQAEKGQLQKVKQ